LRTKNEGSRRGIAAIAVGGCAVALVAIVLLATSAGGSNGGYTIRAIFDDANNLVSGENVKVDGVDVGTVGSVTATPHAQAAVVLNITNPDFKNFRTDSSCEIRPQALIGEKYVDCLPTQPRVENTQAPPFLKVIPSGEEGAGQYLMPVTNTHSPVEVDLLGDITRLPERQRFTIILNEFGAGLAGRGPDLNAVIKRANPALQEVEKVLAILANENKVLTNLAEEGDKAVAPLAADRGRLVGFINESNKIATASANQRVALGQNFADFPAFLEQLGPAVERLQRFAEQTTPTLESFGVAAPGINKLFKNIAPFANTSTAFFKSFGATGRATGPALKAVEPLLPLVKSLGKEANPFASNFSSLLTSVRSTGGLERLLDFIYLGAGNVNGYDTLGHFIRAEGVAGTCLSYAVETTPGCSTGKFIQGSTASVASSTKASAAGVNSTSLVMARTLAVLKGMTPAQAIARYPGSIAAETGAASTPSTTSASSPASAQPVGGAAAGTTYYTPGEENSEASGMLLNYLLGN
jgi:phospholipid/cholesterol/gamma-HCH transport system substrate-binding protein